MPARPHRDYKQGGPFALVLHCSHLHQPGEAPGRDLLQNAVRPRQMAPCRCLCPSIFVDNISPQPPTLPFLSPMITYATSPTSLLVDLTCTRSVNFPSIT
eukprot:c5206_g1_i1 orf=102-401(+)